MCQRSGDRADKMRRRSSILLRRRSLVATIALAFASLLAIMAGVVAFAIHEVDTTEAQRRTLVDELLQAAAAADRMALNAIRFDDAVQALVVTRSPDDLSAARLSRAFIRRAAADMASVRLPDRQDDYLAAQVETAAADFQRQAPEAERYAVGAAPDRARAFVHQYLKGTVAEFAAAAERLGGRLENQAAVIRSQITLREERLTRSLIFAFGLAGLVSILQVLYCLHLVTEPVGRLVLAARAVETGDYSLVRQLGEEEVGPAQRASQNELTALARAFTHMAAALEEREQRLRAQTAHLAAANADLTALQSLTDVALSDLPLNPLLEQLLQRVVSGVGGDAGAVFLTDPASGRLEPRATVNIGDEFLRGVMRADAEGFAASLAAAGELVQCADLATQPAPSAPYLSQRGVAAYVAAPIQLGGRVVGVAHVDFFQAQSLEPPALNLMQVFGERVARAIERSRALEELESWGRELERRVTQQQGQLLRAERLAAIGLVGGSIAHELRNPLGVISNAVYFLRRRAVPLEEKMRRHLDIIEREVLHSIRIINGLVDYSSGIEPETRRLNLNGLVRTALEDTAVPETIAVDLALDADLPMVVGDESQLLQVFAHLIRNAVQAMEGKGELKIATGASDASVWARVQDTGPGVPLEDQARIFEPLVTTRAKGMGLGLSLARKILEAHGGEIRLASEPGSGATFTVALPILDHVPGSSVNAPANLPSYR